MVLFDLLKNVLETAKSYPTEHPVMTWILAAIYAALTIFLVVMSVKNAKGAAAKIVTFFYSLIRASCIMIAGFVFLVGGAEASFDINVMSNRFYIEVIIVTVLFGLSTLGVLALTEDPNSTDDSDYESMGGSILRGFLFIVLSAIFLFTKLDDKLVGWGFQIFGHKIGDWILSWYLAAAVWCMLGLAQNIIQLFFILIFRRPGSRRNLPR